MRGSSDRRCTRSAASQVHVFDMSGKKLKDIPLPLYGNMVRSGRGDEAGPAIIVGGSNLAGAGEMVVRVDLAGKVKWELKLPEAGGAKGRVHIVAMSASTVDALATVGTVDGTVFVLYTDTGKIIATTTGQGMAPEAAFFTDAETKKPAFGVLTKAGIAAFRIK